MSKDVSQGPSSSGLQSSLVQARLHGMLKCFCIGKELLRDLKRDLGIFEGPMESAGRNKGPQTLPTPITSVRRPFSFLLFIAPYGLLQLWLRR